MKFKMQQFLVKLIFLYNTEKPLLSTTNVRKELPVTHGNHFEHNFKVLNIFPLTQNVKPHKVLLTSQVQLFSGCGFFTMWSVFVSSERDLQNNEISWTIEDMNGPFSALDKLKKLWVHNPCNTMFHPGLRDLMEREQNKGSEVWNCSNFCRFLRFLQGNRIRSVTKKSFSGLDALQHLWVGLVFHWLFPKVQAVN